ncbi:hypothetical protein F8388_009725 [Cannabis sativa]|uniref:Uncharacterized protein n=1 Tax=Cannabis sativa TaxID=3483 RepID=A0A7J6H2V6_CANSA|nr:hypothetical protein F8388_009725 [Cannabis sativa]
MKKCRRSTNVASQLDSMIEEFHSSNPNLNESKVSSVTKKIRLKLFKYFHAWCEEIFDADDRGEVIDGDLGKHFDTKNKRLDDCLRYCIVAGKKVLEDVDLGGEKLSKLLRWLKSQEIILSKTEASIYHAKDLSQSEESVFHM